MQRACPNFGSPAMKVSTSKLSWGLGLAAVAVLASWSMRPSHLHSAGNPTTAGLSPGLRRFARHVQRLVHRQWKCAGCHGTDPIAYANVTEDGVDINPTSQWRSSLMANSAKDPFGVPKWPMKWPSTQTINWSWRTNARHAMRLWVTSMRITSAKRITRWPSFSKTASRWMA